MPSKPFLPRVLPLAPLALIMTLLMPHPAHAIAYWGTYGATLWNTPSHTSQPKTGNCSRQR